MARDVVPKYRSIAADLERRIADAEFEPGARLPAQANLADEYGVTIMTLRHALAELERDGRIRTARGSGTFVADGTAVRFGLDRLSSFAQEMEQQGIDVTTEVLGVDDPSSARDARHAREVIAGGGWDDVALVTIVRRRSIAGVPVVVQRSTLPSPIWAAVADTDLGTTTLYAAIGVATGRRVERATESFRAVLVDAEDAARLSAPERSAALESTRISFAGDAPFLVDRALMLGSATEVRAERTADGLRLGYAPPTPHPGSE